MPTALKLIAPFRAIEHACLLFVFSFGLSLVAFANPEPQAAVSNIGFLPNEPTTLSLERDLDLEGPLISCKNLNESAAWFDVCSQLRLGPTPTILFDGARLQNRDQKKNTAPFLWPLVEVRNQQNEVLYYRFVQMARHSFEKPKAELPAPTARLSINTIKREASCELLPIELDEQVVRKEWILKRFVKNGAESDNQLVIDNDILSFESFKGFDSLSCQFVIFDGLLFKRVQTTHAIRTIEIIPNRAASPLRVQQLEDFFLISLEHIIGPRETERPYSCQMANDDPLLPNICEAFDLITGHIPNNSFNAPLLQKILRDSPTIYHLRIGKQRPGAASVDVPLEIEIMPHQTVLDSFKKEREIPVLRIEHDSSGARVLCETKNLAPEKRSALVNWKINNQLFPGWSASALHTLLVAFGNTYECGVDEQWSQPVTLDARYLKLNGPDRIVLLSTDETALVTVEPSLFLDDVKRTWSCATSDVNLSCRFLDAERNSRRLVEVRRLSKNAVLYASTLKLTLTIDGMSAPHNTLTKDVILQSEADKTYVDISSHISLKQDTAAGAMCGVDSPSEDVTASHMQFFWLLNGRIIPSTQKNYLPFERRFVGQLLSCIVKIRKGNFYGMGAVSLMAESPQPQFRDLPDIVAFDLQHENNVRFELSDRYQSSLEAHCQLVHNNFVVLKNICTLADTQSRRRSVNVTVSLTDLQKLNAVAQQLNRSDPYFLSGFELVIEVRSAERTLSRRVRAHLFRPNVKPRILFAHHYFDDDGMQVCRFAFSDANNDHLNAKLYFNADPTRAFSFSTFERAGATTLQMHFSDPGKQVVRTGFVRARRVSKARPGCQIILSDGTLFSSAPTIGKRNAIDSTLDADQMIARTVSESAKMFLSQASNAVQIAEPFVSTADATPPRFPLKTDLRILDLYADSSRSETSVKLDDGVRAASPVCLGSKRICNALTISGRRLAFSTRGLFPTEEVIVILRDTAMQPIIYNIVIHNRVDKPKPTCALSDEFDSFSLATEIVSAERSLFVPRSLLTSALAQGFQIPSCSTDTELKLQTESKAIEADIYHPHTNLISLLDVLFQSKLSPSTFVNASRFKLSDCRISNGQNEGACQYNPENLLVMLPAAQEKNLMLYAKVSYMSAGRQVNETLIVNVLQPQTKHQVLKVSMKAIANTPQGQIHCVASGLESALYDFELYEGQVLIGQLQTSEPVVSFNIHAPSQNSLYICQLRSGNTLVSSSTMFDTPHDGFESTCYTNLLESIPCSPAIYSSQTTFRRFDEISQFLERELSSKGSFLKIKTRSQSSHLMSSETIEFPKSLQGRQSSVTTPIESTRIYLSNTLLDRPICFNGFRFRNDNNDNELKARQSSPNCLQASIPETVEKEKIQGENFLAKTWFFPDADVVMPDVPSADLVKKWSLYFGTVKAAKQTVRIQKIVCKAEEPDAIRQCDAFAKLLKSSLPESNSIPIELSQFGFLAKQVPYKALLVFTIHHIASGREQEFESIYFY